MGRILARMRAVISLATLAILMSGCSGPPKSTVSSSMIETTVTLSRSGGLGPSLDHVPQREAVVTVTVTDAAGVERTATTDADGRARLAVPVGEYDVSTGFCPFRPQHVVASPGAVVRLTIDCLAP